MISPFVTWIRFKRVYRAFTFIEVMLVIVIIGILAGIALSMYSSHRQRAEKTVAISNARQCLTALAVLSHEQNNPGGEVTASIPSGCDWNINNPNTCRCTVGGQSATCNITQGGYVECN